MIFKESTKSCIDSTSFYKRNFFSKIDRWTRGINREKGGWGGVQRVFEKKISYKFVGSMPIFALCKDMKFVLLVLWLIQTRKRAQKSTFHEFYNRFPNFFAFSSCSTTLYQTFSPSTFVSKDAEFRGLSDGRFKFLGQICSRVLMPQIQLKSTFWTIDPPSLLEEKYMTKHFALNN